MDIKIKHDCNLQISTGRSRYESKWKNTQITWKAFLERISQPTRTHETIAEYKAMSKTKQDDIKDVGGYVGGTLKQGKRKTGYLDKRSMITLDADYADTQLLDTFYMTFGNAAAVYSTHKHTPNAPRLRLIIPLSREVEADEYEAAARMLAFELGIDKFDDTTYQPTRLMYWPSVSRDGEYLFDYVNDKILDPDKLLNKYTDWTDTSYWPESSRAVERIHRSAKKQGDPRTKAGLVGAFCRTYEVEEAIDKFLPDRYTKGTTEGRYTYTGGSTSGGLVVYDDGLFAYSNHATDPASGQLCNAFDLVRLHLYSALDDEVDPKTPINKYPSYKAMTELCQKDDGVKRQLTAERLEDAKHDFEDAESSDDDGDNWVTKLQLEKSGAIKDSLDNIVLILTNDINLKGISYNSFRSAIDFRSPPPWKCIKYPTWTDTDISQLHCYLSDIYGIYSPNKTRDALNAVIAKRKHHPVREYLKALPDWDGTVRAERLLIDYLGAEENAYVKAVTRKTLVAAVARVFVPGIKFDSVLVMDGPQDKGKSTLFNKLAGDEWYNDCLTLTEMQDKAGAEKLQGYWILELGELTGMRKADIDSIKSFISRRDDKYRASYGRVVESHPRQCVIVATVNSMGGFLRDPTGNRRFWPVQTPGSKTGKYSWGLTENDIEQIWAEAMHLWKSGEKLYLEGDEKAQATEEQNAALETDPREGMVAEFLERLVPADWNSTNKDSRQLYLDGRELPGPSHKGVEKRRTICTAELWCECFGKDQSIMRKQDSYELTAILRKLGWVQSGERIRVSDYGLQRVWERQDMRQDPRQAL